jgi:hypothetical protein
MVEARKMPHQELSMYRNKINSGRSKKAVAMKVKWYFWASLAPAFYADKDKSMMPKKGQLSHEVVWGQEQQGHLNQQVQKATKHKCNTCGNKHVDHCWVCWEGQGQSIQQAGSHPQVGQQCCCCCAKETEGHNSQNFLGTYILSIGSQKGIRPQTSDV